MVVAAASEIGELEASGTGFTLDVDGDGRQSALTDGLLIIRALFGFEGDALIAEAVSQDATRSGIGEYILANLQDLDIDGDGVSRPLTDGLLVIRFLFGFEGQALIQGAVSEGAARETSQSVTDFLQQISDSDNDGIVDFLENRPPVIALLGAREITLAQGEDASDPGATADDREDGDLSSSVDSDWDTVVRADTPGTYTVTYQVTDSEGELGVAQRVVIVQTSTLAKLVGRWQLDGDGAASVGPRPAATSGGHQKTRETIVDRTIGRVGLMMCMNSPPEANSSTSMAKKPPSSNLGKALITHAAHRLHRMTVAHQRHISWTS